MSNWAPIEIGSHGDDSEPRKTIEVDFGSNDSINNYCCPGEIQPYKQVIQFGNRFARMCGTQKILVILLV